MTLEFEKLTPELDGMAHSAQRRARQTESQVDTALRQLRAYGRQWERIEASLARAERVTDAKFYRAARPLDRVETLDCCLDPCPCPPEATLIAADGSQILPDRHAAFLYYLINIGIVVYFHGSGRGPLTATWPTLAYPRLADGVGNGAASEAALEEEEDDFAASSAVVNVRRDLAEIDALAEMAGGYHAPLLLALMDQRLLYWPALASRGGESDRAVDSWLAAMGRLRRTGALLAGYIDRPGKSSVITLLETVENIERPGYDITALGRRSLWQGPTDVDLFCQVLGPGQRSKTFVEVSEHNRRFREDDPAHEICFFYLNPGRNGRQIARVDIPRWVAEDSAQVEAVHSLLYDQCTLAGNYPYVLTRADEMAVVGRQDQAELEYRIALRMQAVGLDGEITAKQWSKELARGTKSRHEV
jgi:hypothetical protein